MTDPSFSLAGDFPPMDHAQWTELASAALKGAPLKKLVQQIGGLEIQPLYTRTAKEPATGWPGFAPFVRGARADQPRWDIRQVYRQPSLDALNNAILTDLARGVTSVDIVLDSALRAGRDISVAPLAADGAPVANLADLERGLERVYDDLASVSIDGGAAAGPAAALTIALAKKRGHDPQRYRGRLQLDPVGSWLTSAAASSSVEAQMMMMTDVAAYTHAEWPQIRAIRVDGAAYHDAGAYDSDELAAILATGVAYLEALSSAGLTPAEAARQVTLRVALDAEMFAGIAKLRALRQTWGRVLQAANAESAVRQLHIEATTSRAMMTQRDPWVNMLRTTSACVAAATGGADSIHVRPFDEAVGLPDELSLRVARNTQVILQDESNLGQVIDPAGGAWYIESLTRAMAEAAWARFQDIQREGGIIASLRAGLVQERIDASWAERETALARRKAPLTGVSEFPNLDERKIPDRQPDPANALQTARTRLAQNPRPTEVRWARGAQPAETTVRAIEAAAAGATIDQLLAAWTDGQPTGGNAPARPLAVRRRAAGFEALRDASDRHQERAGYRPQVLLAKLGPLSEHIARATYAKNFFEAGGIESLDAVPVDAGSVAAVVSRNPSAKMAIICGTDARYADEAAAVATALKAAGIARVYLAGRPGEHEASYRAAGIDEFIFIGANVLALLQGAHAFIEQDAGDRS